MDLPRPGAHPLSPWKASRARRSRGGSGPPRPAAPKRRPSPHGVSTEERVPRGGPTLHPKHRPGEGRIPPRATLSPGGCFPRSIVSKGGGRPTVPRTLPERPLQRFRTSCRPVRSRRTPPPLRVPEPPSRGTVSWRAPDLRLACPTKLHPRASRGRILPESPSWRRLEPAHRCNPLNLNLLYLSSQYLPMTGVSLLRNPKNP